MSWNMCASWLTTPIRSRSDCWVTSRTSTPPTRTAPDAHVVDPRDQLADRRLAGTGRPDQRDQLARLGPERHAVQHLLRPVPCRARRRPPARPATPPRRSGRGSARRRTRCCARRPGSSTASGASSIIGSRSSTSKTRSKLTSALITSTRAFDSAVSGPYSRVSSSASVTTVPADSCAGRSRSSRRGRRPAPGPGRRPGSARRRTPGRTSPT